MHPSHETFVPEPIGQYLVWDQTFVSPDDTRPFLNPADANPSGADTHVHDGIWSPADIVRHCEQVREEIAERQKHLTDVPV